MTNFKKFLISGVAITMAFGMAALAGCVAPAPEAKDFTFECEEMVIEGSGTGSNGEADSSIETEGTYVDGTQLGDEETFVGTFSNEGSTLTFVVTSDFECDATFTLYAASAKMGMAADWSDAWIDAIDLEEVTADGVTVSITNNGGNPITLKGTLPGTTWEGGFAGMGTPGVWHHVGSGTGTIHLVKGKNTIVIEHIETIAINYDKVVINAAANLKWEPTDNSDIEV